MNTNPDDETLALWLDDGLAGVELAKFEATLAGQPEKFSERAEIRRLKEQLALALPLAEEPPYADFFNHRVMRSIGESGRAAAPVAEKSRAWFCWKLWGMPLAACVGMALAFFVGMESQHGETGGINVTNAPRAIPVETFVYTPDVGVKARWFESDSASAAVLVLSGIEPIPDQVDFSETAGQPWETDTPTVDSNAVGGEPEGEL